jgi:excisionase family DNA binding protein
VRTELDSDAALLTTAAVLRYLNTTPRTLYRLIAAGELPAVRIGQQWRFRRGDLDAWVERHRAVTSEDHGTGNR